MYFDFDDRRPDITPVGRAITWRDGVILSIVVHAGLALALITAPDWMPEDFLVIPTADASAVPPPDEPPRMVFVRPRADELARQARPRAPLSDEDRVARTRERAPAPQNAQPLSRGNTTEPVEPSDQQRARGQGPAPDPSVGQQARAEPVTPFEPSAATAASPPVASEVTTPSTQPGTAPRTGGGSLGEELRNLGKYIERNQHNNPQGGGSQFGPAIQFDTKGVDFGRWIARFKIQVENNWWPLIPQAAISLKGRVVITFNVHKNGTISDLTVASPSSVDSFNTAAFGALSASNPTIPLPPEYPADKAFFTVTFFYNEQPR